MTDPIIGEIRPFGFGFAPPGWEVCRGQVLQIDDNPALFRVLGNRYGGDGIATFGLPDLRDAVPMCWGKGDGLTERVIGEKGGESTVSLSVGEMPSHSHSLNASSDLANARQPSNQLLAQGDGVSAYGVNQSPTTMFVWAISLFGDGTGHNNEMPFLTVNFCIAVQGWYPTEA